jgi:2-keto-4-pentenoate hydratase/2-oxohepta-3-ene-1,7-dioic acid hydratase in catechol pathway
MRLLRYRDSDGTHLGTLHNQQVVDLTGLSGQGSGPRLTDDMLSVIEMGDDGLNQIRHLLQGSLDQFTNQLDSIELLAPLQPPRENIMAIGHNYQAHVEEQSKKRGEAIGRPTVFTKAQSSVTGPHANIPIDEHVTKMVDWEGELGVIVGRGGINIAADQALHHVFGYTVVNDLSARDVQYGWGGQYFKGKSLDSFCPMGPWIVTADEIPDPQTLRVQTRVNGESKQDGNTADMIFPVAEIIAQLSLGMTLLPGNLIATGTPSGVGYARSPQEFLHPGDVLETEITGIGVLRNCMVVANAR